MRRSLFLLLLMSLSLLIACGGGEEGFVSTGPIPAGGAANVEVKHDVSRLKTIEEVGEYFLYYGKDNAGKVVYGPVSHRRAPSQVLAQVPIAVTQLRVEYRDAQGNIQAVAEPNVQLAPGTVTQVTAVASPAQLQVQLTNDNSASFSDSQVYVILSGANVTLGTGKPIPFHVYGTGAGGAATAVPLSSLTQVGNQTSPYTGDVRPVYGFNVTSVNGGRLWVSYGSPVVYTSDADPDASTPYRLDKMELAFNASGNGGGGADLTSLDYYGIPMELQAIGFTGAVQDVRTFYASTPTILKQIYALRGNNQMGSAFLQTPSPGASPAPGSSPSPSPTPASGWNPNTDSLSTFLRVLGPQTIAGNPGATSAFPYTSFASYLNSMVGKPPLILTGNGGVGYGTPNTSYFYEATVSPDGKGGFIVSMIPTQPMTNAPFGLTPAPSPVPLAANLPVTLSLPKNQLDFAVYSAGANTWAVPVECDEQGPSKNSIYATIVGDFVSAVQFGYINGKGPNNSSAWYSSFPVLLPFANARPTNDGFYNPYASIFYNLSDSYGFPFSDRNGRVSPLLDIGSVPVMLVRVLGDNRLDAPLGVTVSNATSSTVSASWLASPSASGYNVTCYDGYHDPIVVSTTQTSANVTGLNPGTAYSLTVVATQGNVRSAAGPLNQFMTTGNVLTPSGSPVPMGLTINLANFPPPAANFTVNGTSYIPAASATATPPPAAPFKGAVGVNQIPVVVKGLDPNNPSSQEPVTLNVANFWVDVQSTAGNITVGNVTSSDGSQASGTPTANSVNLLEVFGPRPPKVPSAVTLPATASPTPFPAASPLPSSSVAPSGPGSSTLIGAPTVTGFSPTLGNPGTQVAINGTNFIPGSQVFVGGVQVASPNITSCESIIIFLTTANTGKVTVVSPLGVGTSNQTFTFDGVPTVTALQPAQGPPGANITVVGTGYLTASNVQFNGVPANYSVVNDTQITALVPADSKASGPVSVVNPAGTGNSTGNFTVTPQAFTFTPTSGQPGTLVTLTATSGSFVGATNVQFGGVPVNALNITSGGNVITTTVPAAAVDGPITVVYPNISATSGNVFTLAAPAFTYAPTSGPVGTVLTLSATNGTFNGANQVQIGGGVVNITTNPTGSTLTVTVPSTATSGNVTVIFGSLRSTATQQFQLTAPSFSMLPILGGYFQQVTLKALNAAHFGASPQVLFNGVPARSVTLSPDNKTITTAVPPASSSGNVTVVQGGVTSTSNTTFTVTHPIVTSFSPTSGAVGDSVTITGRGFLAATSNGTAANLTSSQFGQVFFSGVPQVVYSVLNDTVINTTVPSGARTGNIQVNDVVTGTASNSSFTVTP